jgi:hypothetical protein
MNDFITAVQAEREHQKVTWSSTFDDKQWNALDWKSMIDDYTAFYRRRWCQGRHNEALENLVKVAALAMAAYEAAQP